MIELTGHCDGIIINIASFKNVRHCKCNFGNYNPKSVIADLVTSQQTLIIASRKKLAV
jgi:hypothetical protein